MTAVIVLAILWVFCGLYRSADGTCSGNGGPAGSSECVAVPQYNNQYQWATCVTDSYIRQKSWDRHQCENQTDTYCYYECMCESFDTCTGPTVNHVCACHPHDTAGLTRPQSTLPPRCFSPSGDQCSWYQDCLERRHPCEGTDAAYAITYAKKICDLYSDHYDRFSSDGKHWINAVRKCLQVQLVPMLRPWINPSCSDIKTTAFASHTKCYASPASGISYCSLGLLDNLRIFWTIKGAFISAFSDTLNGLWSLTAACARRHIGAKNETTSARVRIAVSNVKHEHDLDEFLGWIVDKIADEKKWKERGLDWFVPTRPIDNGRKKREIPSKSNPTLISRVDVFLVAKREFDLNSPTAPVVNVTEEVTSLVDSVKNDMGPLAVGGVPVTVLSACYII